MSSGHQVCWSSVHFVQFDVWIFFLMLFVGTHKGLSCKYHIPCKHFFCLYTNPTFPISAWSHLNSYSTRCPAVSCELTMLHSRNWWGAVNLSTFFSPRLLTSSAMMMHIWQGNDSPHINDLLLSSHGMNFHHIQHKILLFQRWIFSWRSGQSWLCHQGLMEYVGNETRSTLDTLPLLC